MSVFNFYVDTSTSTERDNIKLLLDTPIQTQQNEYLEIKVLDVSMMNDNYNISSSLNNNQFTIERTEVYYEIIPSNPKVLSPIINVTDFYHSESGNNLLNTIFRDDADGYEFIRNTDYQIYFYDTRIVEGDNNHLIHNIFDDIDISNTMRISETYDTHFVIENRAEDDYDFLDSVEVGIINDGNTIPTETTFTFSVSYSNDNETYTDFNVSNNEITYPANPLPNFTSVRFTTININHPVQPHAYKYYRLKFSVDNAVINDTDYEWVRMRMIKNTFTLNPTSTIYNETITIPDGFYNSTNFINTLNTLLTPYNLTLSIVSTTNKLLFNNSNPASHIYHSYDDIEEKNTLKIILDNHLLKRMFGFNNTITELTKASITTADNNINLLHYQKLVLTTDLCFNIPTNHTLKEWKEDKGDGMRNILLWIAVDNPPYTIIKYRNYEGITYRINDSYISSLNFYFYNEFKQSVDINRLLFHIQITKKNISYI